MNIFKSQNIILESNAKSVQDAIYSVGKLLVDKIGRAHV